MRIIRQLPRQEELDPQRGPHRPHLRERTRALEEHADPDRLDDDLAETLEVRLDPLERHALPVRATGKGLVERTRGDAGVRLSGPAEGPPAVRARPSPAHASAAQWLTGPLGSTPVVSSRPVAHRTSGRGPGRRVSRPVAHRTSGRGPGVGVSAQWLTGPRTVPVVASAAQWLTGPADEAPVVASAAPWLMAGTRRPSRRSAQGASAAPCR